jgi:hypothetical protein
VELAAIMGRRGGDTAPTWKQHNQLVDVLCQEEITIRQTAGQEGSCPTAFAKIALKAVQVPWQSTSAKDIDVVLRE